MEQFNHDLFAVFAASPDRSVAAPFGTVFLAEWTILLGPALLVWLWICGSSADRRAAIGACLSALSAVAVAALLSMLIWHPRPFMDGLFPNYLHHAPDSSFPSDHATLLFALGFALWLVPPVRLPRVWMVMIALAAAVGWARVYLGVHYPFDIIGAAMVGLLPALVFASLPGRRASDAVTQFAEWLYGLVLVRVRPRKHL